MIKNKLNVLKESGTINQKNLDFNLKVLEFLKEQQIIKKDSEAETFITHLAMAISRDNVEVIDRMPNSILEDIKLDKNFEKAKLIWEKIEKESPIVFPENEMGYIYLHLINLL